MTDSEHWLPVWRGLALSLLRDGYCPTRAVEQWARENGVPLRVVSAAVSALAIECFEYAGETYWRLSGKVVPILPRDVRSAVTYRQAGGGRMTAIVMASEQ
jgi:hypothetical protein